MLVGHCCPGAAGLGLYHRPRAVARMVAAADSEISRDLIVQIPSLITAVKQESPEGSPLPNVGGAEVIFVVRFTQNGH